jgi:ribonuclease-3
VLEVEGPPHDRTFTAAAVVDGAEIGIGRGRSKKDAEQRAAKEALAKITEEPGGTASAAATG